MQGRTRREFLERSMLAAGAAALAGGLLAGLRAKGETADEIRGFAMAMRELAHGKPTARQGSTVDGPRVVVPAGRLGPSAPPLGPGPRAGFGETGPSPRRLILAAVFTAIIALGGKPVQQLKDLIARGKEQGYLTYAEVNDHLPSGIVDPEQIEDIVNMINDMGIAVHEKAPDAESILLSDAAVSNDDDAAEEAEAALASVDAEFGRTTDPVRMYMREMGTVELLTRQGEIEIAIPVFQVFLH